MTLLGPNGKPISSNQFKKAAPPALGERFGSWGGESVSWLKLPGGGLIGFDLSKLTLGDFRQMKDHYQINSSLAILTFMMHQMEWTIECEDRKLRDDCEEQLTNVWSRLVRAKSQGFWAGYSPNVLQWENDVDNRAIVLDKVKDLIPEDCKVNWKKIKPAGSVERDDQGDLFVNNHIYVYDGIKQYGWAKPIPVENSYWYPLLMENGDYYGRKLLRPAFQSWFFSILLHLFANRYYERFGEPTPVGRAPFDDVLDFPGEKEPISGNKAMELILTQIRNRSAVVLPNDKTPVGDETTVDYDYTIEYLESQMRGADFEKYMTRLDEEMSLALFTPILMMRTADVGSYNLGTQHVQMYLWLLNAISEDWAQYINKYILHPIARYNSPRGLNHPPVKIKFRRVGKDNIDLVRDIVREGVADGRYKPNLEEISQLAGLDVTEIRQLTAEDPDGEDDDPPTPGEDDPATTSNSRAITGRISARLAPQVQKAYRKSEFPQASTITFGFEKLMREAFEAEGLSDPERSCETLYNYLRAWAADIEGMGHDYLSDSEAYMRAFNVALDNFLVEVISRG